MSDNNNKALSGGEFLIRDVSHNDIFIPEEWTEEQKMIKQTCADFVQQEVVPLLDRIDAMEEGLMPSLLEKAGELGLLGISVPEEFGGMGMDPSQTILNRIRRTAISCQGIGGFFRRHRG